jgi:hypothetical protein
MSPFALFGSKEGHPRLFADICRFHEIDRRTRSLLDRIVKTLNMKEPGAIFLDDKWLVTAYNNAAFEADKPQIAELTALWFSRRI